MTKKSLLKKVGKKKTTKNTTKKITNKKNKKTTKKTIKKIDDVDTIVWGKNKELEKFWEGLATGKYVVVIYKNGKNEYIKIPSSTKKITTFYNDFDNDKQVKAVLSSYLSQDSYELYLYPKAKDKTVEYVIKNYNKYFKSINSKTSSKDISDTDKPLMKKVRVPA